MGHKLPRSLIATDVRLWLRPAQTAPTTIRGLRFGACHGAFLQVATNLLVAFPGNAPDIYGQRLCALPP